NALFRTAMFKQLRQLEGPKEGIGSLAFTADGKTAGVYGAANKSAYIWLYDTATGKQRLRVSVPTPAPDANGNFQMPMTAVAGLTFSPDGRLFAATSDHHTLGLWDATTGRDSPPIRAPDEKPIEAAVFTPDSRCLALKLEAEDAVRLWEIASGKERRQYG